MTEEFLYRGPAAYAWARVLKMMMCMEMKDT